MITASHATVWQAAITETRIYLRRKDLSANQRRALKDKAADMEALIRLLEPR